MYRIIVAVLILFFIIMILNKKAKVNKSFWQFSRKIFFEAIKQLILLKNSRGNNNIISILRNAFFSLAVLTFIIMAVSSFVPVLVLGESLQGAFLIVHVTTAPIFVLAVTVSVILMVHNLQFNYDDFIFLKNFISKKLQNSDKNTTTTQNKLYFWLFAFFVIPAILSILLSMYPIFGTAGQEILLDMHRFSVLVLSALFGFSIITKYSDY